MKEKIWISMVCQKNICFKTMFNTNCKRDRLAQMRITNINYSKVKKKKGKEEEDLG